MNGSLQPIIAQLDELFNVFNEQFYYGELQKPIITVSPDMTAGAYGWCTSWKAWKRKVEEGEPEGYYEINMCAEHLTRPFTEICGTLLHEMVHLWNLQVGVQDTSRGGTYHNKRFKTEAEKRGLIIEKDAKYGWTITTLSPEATEFVESLGHTGFTLSRTKMTKLEATKAKKKSSSRKYVCPVCGQSIRATKETNILCGDCTTEDNLVRMELEDEGDED